MPGGRPKGSKASKPKNRSKSGPRRVDTKRCNKCGSQDHIRSTKLQCPKYFDPVPCTAEKGTRKRGRPKGSKNKPKRPRSKRGRPLGSKNRPKSAISVLHQLSTYSSSFFGGLNSTNIMNTQPSSHGHTLSFSGLDEVEVGHQLVQIRRGRGRPLGSKNKPKKSRKRGRPKKQKGKAPSKSSSTSMRKRKARLESNYCKVCGSQDHVRSTRRQCPKHPAYEPQGNNLLSHKRMRSDSYEMPRELLYPTGDEGASSGGDWSGRPDIRVLV